MKKLFIILLSFIPVMASADLGGGQRADDFKYTSTSDITNTTAVEVGAAKTGKKYCVTGITVSNTDTSVITIVNLLDGTTPIWHCPATSNGGGCVVPFDPPLCGTSNTALKVQAVTDSAQVRVSVKGRLALDGE